METKTGKEGKPRRKKLRVLGASAAARELGCSAWHVSEVARGNRRSKRVEPVVQRLCKVVEVEE
ncbi:MAG: hypothetical protein ACOX9C_06525 [Kiritimatiellia bacterium]|jgi:hypothetical protein